MFRKRAAENIDDEEYYKYDFPFFEKCLNYLEKYIIPNYIAFYIAHGYYSSGLRESSFSQHFNSAADMFNISLKHRNLVIEETKKALKIKYSLEVIKEKPLLKVKEIINIIEPSN